MALEPIKFNSSEAFTLGVELETQLVGADSFALVPESSAVIDLVCGEAEECRRSVKHELLMSNIEVTTDICHTAAEAGRDLHGKLAVVIAAAEKRGARLAMAGTHPFSRWEDQVVTDAPRYRRLLDMLQLVARRFNIFGFHVHVGVSGPERCIYIMNRFLFYLPHLLALSTNSPFWESMETGLKSYRTKIFESLPVGGMPFYFDDWDDYSRLVESYIRTGTIETIRELWWDVRPHPDFGTIEVRICDMPPTVKECVSIAALIQAMVKKFDGDFEKGDVYERPHPSVVRENKWRACRWGLGGEFLTRDGMSTVKVTDALRALVAEVADEAASLGSEAELAGIGDILEAGTGTGTGAERQERLYKDGGSFEGVVSGLSEVLYGEVDEFGKASGEASGEASPDAPPEAKKEKP